MANEFIIKHGFLSKGNSEVTGSLKVTEGISGSFSGSFQGDGSDLNLANNTTIPTSSPFPLNGDAVISGSLTVTSSFVDFSGLTDIKTRKFAISSGDYKPGTKVISASFYDGFVEALDASIDGDFIHCFANDSSSVVTKTFEDKNVTIIGNGHVFKQNGYSNQFQRWNFVSCSFNVYDFTFHRDNALGSSYPHASMFQAKDTTFNLYNAGFSGSSGYALGVQERLIVNGGFFKGSSTVLFGYSTPNDGTEIRNAQIYANTEAIDLTGDNMKVIGCNVLYSQGITSGQYDAITLTGNSNLIQDCNVEGDTENIYKRAINIGSNTGASVSTRNEIVNCSINQGEIQASGYTDIQGCHVFSEGGRGIVHSGTGSIQNCSVEVPGYPNTGFALQLSGDLVKVSNVTAHGNVAGVNFSGRKQFFNCEFSANGSTTYAVLYGTDVTDLEINNVTLQNELANSYTPVRITTSADAKLQINNLSSHQYTKNTSGYSPGITINGASGTKLSLINSSVFNHSVGADSGTSTVTDIRGITGSIIDNFYAEGYKINTIGAISSSIVNSHFVMKSDVGYSSNEAVIKILGNENILTNNIFEIDKAHQDNDPVVKINEGTHHFKNNRFRAAKTSGQYLITGSANVSASLVNNVYEVADASYITASNVNNITSGFIDGKGNWHRSQTTSSFGHIEATSLKIEGVVSASKFTANSGSLVGDLSISKTTGTGAPGTGTTHSIAVTVNDPDGGGNKYYLDSVLTGSVVMNQGDAYKFDQSDSSNGNGGGHPFRFSTGVNGSGTAPYEVGVTVAGTPGSAGAYTLISITAATTAPLYYYCTNHSGMGGGVLSIDSGSLNPMAGFANITGSTNLTGSLNLADNTKLKLGNSGDLEIYHDGSNSYIDEVGTGALFYRGGTQTFQNATGTKTMLTLNAASSVDLRFNNSTKLSTTNTGISVSNEITASGAISSSGIISMATASIGGGLFTSASLAAGGGGGGGGSAFPFAGDGVISGSLLISSSNVSGVSTASMTLQGSGSTIFDIQGSQGQLFSVTDDLIHDVFNVSDISGDTLLKVSGSGLVEVPVGPISSSGLLFISASENAGQSTYKTLVHDPATGRIYHTGSYSTGGGGGGSGETYDLNATQDGDNVDLNLTSTSGTDNSVVQLTAGSNITLTRNSATEVTIASSGGGGSSIDTGSLKDTAITGSLIVTGSVVNFASASSVLLPAETVPLINPKVEYLTISEITASGTTVPLPNSLTFISSSTFEYLEIFINGLRLRYDIDFAPMSTSTVKYLTTIPSGSEVTYKSLRR